MLSKKKLTKKLLAASIAVTLLSFGFGFTNLPTVQAKAIPPGFDLEAHRGGRDARPENTLISYAFGMESGVMTLEMDMQMTKDGYIVMSHNPSMNHNIAKGPDGKYVPVGDPNLDIRTMTLAQVKQYDVGTMNPEAGDYYDAHGKTQIAVPGTKMPTLEEVFELANSYGNKDIFFNIETKIYADKNFPEAKNSPDPVVFVKKFYEIVKKYHMENRVMLQSFDWRTLKEMKKLDPNITTVALTCEQPSWGRDSQCRQPYEKGPSPWMAGIDIDTYKGDYVKAAHAIGADIVSPYWEELSNELVAEAHTLGMKVVPWTVNSKASMNMLIDMGVDGFISDKPWLGREVLQERGIKLPVPTININSPYHTGTAIADGTTAVKKRGGDAAE
jgi:glycerophosphoryl diester phosphodiesterase